MGRVGGGGGEWGGGGRSRKVVYRKLPNAFNPGPYLTVVVKRITVKLDGACTVDNRPSTN